MIDKSLKVTAKGVALAALIAASTGGYARAADMPAKAPPVKPVPFFIVNDTSVSFTYFPDATDPGVSGGSNVVPGGIAGERNTFARYQGAIDHFDVWEYGTNLIHVEANQYGSQDPNGGIPGAGGSRELFAFSRSTLGFNELTHSKMFSNPFFTDVGLELGGNYGVQDDYLAEQTTVGVIGLNFNLNLPGTVLLGVLADKEYTHNSFDACGNTGFGVATSYTCTTGGPFSGDREFKVAPRLELFASEPLTFLPWPVTFVNITNVIFPKGTGISAANCAALAFGGCSATNLRDAETKTEVFEDARFTLDASKVFWGKPGIWDTYVGYRYWYNKFGTDHTAPLFATLAPGTSIESTAYVGTTYHFK